MEKKKKNSMAFSTFISIALLAILVVALIDNFDTDNYIEADVLEVYDTTIVVGTGCRAIVAETSPERAYSIETGMAGIIDERPNTHDIFAETLKSFNITLDYVTIDSYVDGIYYSKLVLKTDEKVLRLDSKPSDAIALALRTNSSIYINNTMLEEVGQIIC